MMAQEIIIRAKYCPKSSSFTSSHATTHFGLSMFIFQTFKRLSKWWMFIFTWAIIISYTQVYVGVHYPLDVLAGAFVGCLVGIMMAYIFTKQIGLINFAHQQTFNDRDFHSAFLIFLNALFVMSEIALVSARKIRLESMAEKGDENARAALELSQNPEIFLSAAQVGITLIAILTGVYSGERFGVKLQPLC
jgi:hypothetical protein